MARYIDAEETKTHIQREAERLPTLKINPDDIVTKTYLLAISHAIGDIDFVPTADVVEVVRCGKCKHWKNKRKGILDEYVGDCHNDNFPFHCEQRPVMRECDFCSYGERKENERTID